MPLGPGDPMEISNLEVGLIMAHLSRIAGKARNAGNKRASRIWTLMSEMWRSEQANREGRNAS